MLEHSNRCDCGFSNSLTTDLKPGDHVLAVAFKHENENMNIGTNHVLLDELHLTKME